MGIIKVGVRRKTKALNNMVSYILTMATTIQVSEDLLMELRNRKMYNRESYEELIWDLIEDTEELSEETKRNILLAEEEFRQGKVHTLAKVKKELGL